MTRVRSLEESESNGRIGIKWKIGCFIKKPYICIHLIVNILPFFNLHNTFYFTKHTFNITY